MKLLIPIALSLGAPAAAQLPPSKFQAALKTARPGSVLELGNGNFGALSLSKRSGLTIRAASGTRPLFESINIANSRNIELAGLAVRLNPARPDLTTNTHAVRLYRVEGATLRDMRIQGTIARTGIERSAPAGTPNPGGNVIGLPTGKCVNLTESRRVRLVGSEISFCYRGITFAAVDGLEIVGNDLHDLRGSPLSGGNAQNLLYAENHSYRSTPWALGGAGDHGDAFHLWTIPAMTRHSSGIVIRDNLHEQRDGAALLGYFLEANSERMGFQGAVIERNVLINSDGQGMRLEAVFNSRIERNILLWGGSGDWRKHPRIGFHGGSRDNIVRHNRAAGLDWKGLSEAQRRTFAQASNDFRPTGHGEAKAATAAWLARFRAQKVESYR